MDGDTEAPVTGPALVVGNVANIKHRKKPGRKYDPRPNHAVGTGFVDPIAYAWFTINRRHPFPARLSRDAGYSPYATSYTPETPHGPASP